MFDLLLGGLLGGTTPSCTTIQTLLHQRRLLQLQPPFLFYFSSSLQLPPINPYPNLYLLYKVGEDSGVDNRSACSIRLFSESDSAPYHVNAQHASLANAPAPGTHHIIAESKPPRV